MAERFTISIPKPCHESWAKMSPNEKGRFCSSCAKTVIDFTGKTNAQISQVLSSKKGEKVCGHFYKKQLEGIVIQIPEETLQRQLSYSKLFLLVLLITMGTTLISCTSQSGEKHKIENVVVKKKKCSDTKALGSLGLDYNDIPITGLPELIYSNHDYIEGEVVIMGDIESEEGHSDNYDIRPVPFEIMDTVPRFKGSVFLTKEEAKKDFKEGVSKLIKDNFKIKENKYGLHGVQRIYVYFEINEKGLIENIKVRARHSSLKEEAINVVNMFPEFIPGIKEGKPVSVAYNVPITFKIE